MSADRSTKTMHGKGPSVWKPAPFAKKSKIPLVVFGNAMFRAKNTQKIKGHRTGIVDIIWREIKRRERAGDLVAVTVDEYLSSQASQICSRICHF